MAAAVRTLGHGGVATLRRAGVAGVGGAGGLGGGAGGAAVLRNHVRFLDDLGLLIVARGEGLDDLAEGAREVRGLPVLGRGGRQTVGDELARLMRRRLAVIVRIARLEDMLGRLAERDRHAIVGALGRRWRGWSLRTARRLSLGLRGRLGIEVDLHVLGPLNRFF